LRLGDLNLCQGDIILVSSVKEKNNSL
jgi:hypothetical protein